VTQPLGYRARPAAGPPLDAARFRGRPHRRLRRVLVAVATLVGVVLLICAALWVATPGVSDAPARTAAILRAHDAPSDNGVVADRVATALVATEDSRFYSHSGLDARGALRGALSFSGGGALGGATLDAQLAKLLYTGGRSGLKPTTKQVVLSVKLDSAYSKHEILAMYLDAAYFGHGAYGVVTASRTYFGVPSTQLSWAQATLLAGLVNAPSAYDPTVHLHLARERQRHVLDRLVKTHKLTAKQADEIFAAPLNPAVPFGG
jgi:membrane peptidoglycan carboxypeptidase